MPDTQHSRNIMFMNMKKKRIIIYVIAVITAIPGLYYLFSDPRGLYNYIKWVFNGEIPNKTMPLWITILTFFLYLVFILRPISAYGLLKLKTWGKKLTVGTLSLDFIIRIIGFIHIWTYYDRHPEARKVLEEFQNSMASGQAQHVEYVSMVPSYVIAAFCLISLIVLLKIDFRTL